MRSGWDEDANILYELSADLCSSLDAAAELRLRGEREDRDDRELGGAEEEGELARPGRLIQQGGKARDEETHE